MRWLAIALTLGACSRPAPGSLDAGMPLTAENAYLEAQQKFAARDPAAAEALFQKATSLDPKMVQAYHSLGEVQYAQGKYHEAVASYGRAVAIDSRKAMSWVGLSKAYAATGRTEEAYDAVIKARAMNDKSAAVWRQGAHLEANMDRLDDAVSSLERAASLDSIGAAEDYLTASALRDRAGSLVAAITLAARATEAAPKDSGAWSKLGELKVRNNDLAGAAEAFAKAADFSAGDPTLAQTLGELYLKLQRPADAEAQFRRAIGIKDYCALHLGIARARLALNDRKGAGEEADKCQTLESADEAQETRDFADLSMTLGVYDRAAVLYEALLRAVPEAGKDPRLWVSLARSEKAIGKTRETAIACQRAHALDAKLACP